VQKAQEGEPHEGLKDSGPRKKGQCLAALASSEEGSEGRQGVFKGFKAEKGHCVPS